MELDDRALPLTREQLDIWLAQETGHSGTEWQLGMFVRIEGTVERDALEWAIRRALQEAEPCRAACFEVHGQVIRCSSSAQHVAQTPAVSTTPAAVNRGPCNRDVNRANWMTVPYTGSTVV
jgi:hypothetical protein